ncbi:HSP70-domain-containing protein [Fragilariopsis cylindrus CCMP1102]|uniref:HSP70-domain-containing protein n=1 Tax=Fragilariopsis cylindrus CCMP1102 TaxID=635003 RepID=A0A1E7EWL9_9STRA|nr:HSP70-domain-containing protein [Fragilariopsis cylindrus CCMP1102]|eukprot:OEU10247.1 HSP70-domain-containing protein [Fragilariopsis cylindrus CCMP1102]
MCRANEGDTMKTTKKTTQMMKTQQPETARVSIQRQRRRRGKRDKDGEFTSIVAISSDNDTTTTTKSIITAKKKKRHSSSKALKKHGKDNPSGGLESLVPSLIGVVVLVVSVAGMRGFRGRASVAGIDLGTTNSVICVQRLSKGVGVIDCVSDPLTGSPIIPSVVSVYDLQKESKEIKVGPSSKTKTLLEPHPSQIAVGQTAKRRIDTHPHQTFFHAKRVLGRPYDDEAVNELRQEVEFIVEKEKEQHLLPPLESVFRADHSNVALSPQQVGGYVVNYLMVLTREFLGHGNVKSAVLAVPAKFDAHQRRRTFEAFQLAGVSVARVLEEPTAAALAYGLHKKEGVEKILVYDFGGGTLDISVLHVSEGYCEVIGSDGDDRLGGADFDAAVAHLLTRQHSSVLENLTGYNGVVQDVKSADDEEDIAEILVSSCDRITDDLPLCKTLEITLEEYNTAVVPLFNRSVIPATRLLDDLTLSRDEVDEIVMVGGTTRMPQIRELVRRAFPKAQLNTHIDPDITVAYGAASVND